MYRLFKARWLAASGMWSMVKGSRKGTMWYLIETFLHPRTDRCLEEQSQCMAFSEALHGTYLSVALWAPRTCMVRAVPETAVLHRSRLARTEPFGPMVRFSRASNA